MLTAETTIDVLGGTGKVSQRLGVAKSTVSTWRVRGIPPRRWHQLVRLARKNGVKGITFERLAESHLLDGASL